MMMENVLDGFKFINAQHLQSYIDAKELLASELKRQAEETKKLSAEWKHYPEELRRKNEVSIIEHFDACKKPYTKLLIDIINLASPVVVIPANQ